MNNLSSSSSSALSYFLFTFKPELNTDMAPDKFFNMLILASTLEEAKDIILPRAKELENISHLKDLGYFEFSKYNEVFGSSSTSSKLLNYILEDISYITAYPIYSLENILENTNNINITPIL